jgi:hypothetical protein
VQKSHSSGSTGGSVVAARRELTKNHSGNLEDTKAVTHATQPANRQLLRQGSGSSISVSPKSARTACVFSIDGEANLQGLYLVLRVGKVLKAEPEKELNSFFKPPVISSSL